jgi:Raf kinase inhibitor-like YbhB/YbcL family protein
MIFNLNDETKGECIMGVTECYLLFIAIVISFVFCSAASALTLTSPEFADGGKIHVKAGYEKGNVSPCLEWNDIPEKTASFVLIMDDPDARGWVHWLVYNIPASARSLKADFPMEVKLKDGTLQGLNSFNKSAYGGPCPPSGTHRYVFKLYALDKILELDPGADKMALLKAMGGHILQETSLTGRYSR